MKCGSNSAGGVLLFPNETGNQWTDVNIIIDS